MLALSFSALIVTAQSSNNIDKITQDYYGVKNALAAGKGADAQNSAKTLLADLSAPGKLNADQQKVFDGYTGKLKFDSRHISETTDVAHQREHFESLSKNLYEVLKALKMNSSTIYMQYCPMKKAYWLSENAAIKNPYYSDKTMSACGKTMATVAATK